jgi:hypothetical protein
MKNKTILTAFFVLFTVMGFSQEIVPIEEQFNYYNDGEPYYLKDVNNLLDKFTGEWEYTDNTHYLKIKFYKITGINHSFSPKETYDELRSFILYKEKQSNTWVTVYNTYPATYTINDLNNQNFNEYYCISGNLIGNTNNIAELSYYEPADPCTQQSSCTVKLTYSNPSNNPQLQWNVQDCLSTLTTLPCAMSSVTQFVGHKIPSQLTLNKL